MDSREDSVTEVLIMTQTLPSEINFLGFYLKVFKSKFPIKDLYMSESQEYRVQALEKELFDAKYAAKYYGEKFADLMTQIEQLAMFGDQLLTANGYLRVFSMFSRWDDWYLNPSKYDFLKSKIGDEELL